MIENLVIQERKPGRMKRRMAGMIGLLLFAGTQLLAAPKGWTSKVDLDTRFRYEVQDGYSCTHFGDGRDGFLLGRFILRSKFRSPDDSHRFQVAVKDAHIWDSDLPVRAFSKKNLGMIHDPYRDEAELEETFYVFPLTEGAVAKVGRQKIFFGDKRLFGPGEFGNAGRFIWDGARLTLGKKGRAWNLFYGRTKINHPTRFSLSHRHWYEGAGIYGQIALAGGFTLEPFFAGKWDRRSRYAHEVTKIPGELHHSYWGGRLVKDRTDGLFLDMTTVRETGSTGGNDVDAYGFQGLVGVRSKRIVMQPALSFRYTVGSGDRNPKDGTNHQFDGVFGGIDSSFGRMGMFQWSNIIDRQWNLEFLVSGTQVLFEHHTLSLHSATDGWSLSPSKYRDPTGSSGTSLGTVDDLILCLPSRKGTSVEVGMALFRPGTFARSVTGSSRRATWNYLQLTKAIQW